MMTPGELRQDALMIWQAGVAAVNSFRLVRESVKVTENGLVIAGHTWEFPDEGRICVVGGGKAGAGMAAGFESLIPEEMQARVFGWVNVPENCVQELAMIHLHGARPAGLNEPTEAGVEGVREIQECLSSLSKNDLCVVLISGGGSALLPAPIDGVSLEEKQELTRSLMRAGATIQELNTIRRALSKIKGGGLLRACRAGQLVSLIISDVIGDPLETIASGPTVEIESNPQLAISTLEELAERANFQIPAGIRQALENQLGLEAKTDPVQIPYSNHIIGNNQTAVEAAATRATELGYEIKLKEFDQAGIARTVGRILAETCLKIRSCADHTNKVCLVSGGEPIVELAATDREQKGGRNQELILAAAEVLQATPHDGIAILSGGTDGEDGPTDAAGAMIDSELLERVRQQKLNIEDYLSVNNSYPFFEQIDGLLLSGPTNTNVMDLRVGLIVEGDRKDVTG